MKKTLFNEITMNNNNLLRRIFNRHLDDTDDFGTIKLRLQIIFIRPNSKANQNERK